MNKLIEKNDIEVKDKALNHQTVYLPLGIDMTEVRCLIVGGGRIAARKTKTLLNANASVTILSPSITDRLNCLSKTGQLCWVQSEYQSEYLTNYDFIIAATSDRILNIEIGKDAQRLGKLYCVVSSGRHSKVIFPATYKNEMLTVAVHSNGINCRYSTAIRNRIAAHIEQPNESLQQLIMFGFDRALLSRETFNRLKNFESIFAQNNFAQDKVLILATCQRWECYIQNKPSRQLAREILHKLREALGLSWDECKTNIQYKHEHMAYYHLLNICLGLDSPLLGETEIVSQVRCAMAKWINIEKSQLYETFSSVLLAAKMIRQSSSLTPGGKSWASNIMSLINENVNHIPNANILVVGNGGLSTSVIEKIITSGYRVVNFSRHFDKTAASQNIGYPIYHTDEIGSFLSCTDVLIICSELTPKAIAALKNCKLPFIIDIEGYRDILRQEDNKSGYFGLKEIPQIDLTVEKVRSITTARLKAVEQTLIWHSTNNMVKPPVGIIRIGARRSQLSKAQVAEIQGLLKALTEGIKIEEIFISAPCDRDKKTPLPQVRNDDFFTHDIDQALLAGEIDISIHSAKDLPQKLISGLIVAAITPSIAPWECFISKGNLPLKSLPEGSIIGTSSIRRQENLARLRTDLKIVDVRGNVQNRIEQLDAGKFDALILACAGLIRLGLTDRITEVFSEKLFPHTPGQGSLALVVRESDLELIDFLKPLDLGRSKFTK
ncbi:MAG: hydroxymethylbilane synthase [Phycisphaerae bacterium]|nr:hydroxymethylbilane synthase [Phycisphaerae bacterium]